MFIKHTNLSFILAAVLTACSDNFEPVTGFVPDGSVSFGTYIGNANSRASVVDASALQSSTEGFGVMACLTGTDNYASSTKPNFMYNQQVVYGGGSWNYSPLKYWPSSADEKLSFFAYAPYVDVPASHDAAESGITALSARDAASDPVIEYEFGSDIGKHIDLLYASAPDMTNEAGTVNFEFRHALSRIGFKVCGWESDGSGIGFDDNTTVTVNAVTLSTLRRGASLNLYTGEWSENLNGELQGFTLDGEHLQNNVIRPGDGAVQINTPEGYMMIAPDNFLENGDAAKVYCVLVDYTVETIDPSLHAGKLVVRNKVYRYISPNFEAGKAYTVNIHLGMGNNPGSGDDGTDIVGPAPVDPHPEDPTVPSTGGENSYVRFSASVAEWDGGNDVDIPLFGAPKAVFTASQVDLHIEGSFTYEDPSKAPADDTLTLVSMVKEGSTENLLFAEQTFVPGTFSIPTSNINLGSLESDKSYTLAVRNAYGHIYTVDVPMLFGMMQMTWNIPSADTSVKMPISWGDSPAKIAYVYDDEGQTEEMSDISTNGTSYKFKTAGLKRIKILSAEPNSSGLPQIRAFGFYNYAYGCRINLVSMDTPILRCEYQRFYNTFYDCQSLERIPEDLFSLNQDAETFNSVFRSCKSLRNIPAGIFAYTTKAKDFSYAFNWSAVEGIPYGLFDNCPEATDFSYVFYKCENIDRIPYGLFRNNAKAEIMKGAFGFTSITEIPAGLFETNTLLKDCSSCFYYTNVTAIPAGLFENCKELTSVSQCFDDCEVLSSVPDELFKDCTKLIDAGSLFRDCLALTSVPSGIFENCTSLESAKGIFAFCRALETIPEDLFADCVYLTNVNNAFIQGHALTSIPEGLFRNNIHLRDISYIFQDCNNVVYVPKTLFDNTQEITNAQNAFYRCSSITSEVPPLWEKSVSSYSQCYRGVTNAANYADIPSGWK